MNISLQFLIFAFTILVSCTPVNINFADYDGINLISSSPFGTDWIPAHAGDNNYMTFEELSGVELNDALSRSGLPSGVTSVFRLEIKNQFRNGDFQDSPSIISSLSDIGGGASGAEWESTHTTVADNILWIEDDGTNKVLEFSNSMTGAILYTNLSTSIHDYENESGYIFYIDFFRNNFDPSRLIFPIEFGFDNGTVPQNTERRYASQSNTEDNIIQFPSALFNKANFIITNNSYSRLYFGSENGDEFGSGIDNIRFLKQVDYSVVLTIPFSENGRLNLALGGVYRFSLYVLVDPSVATTPNRFASSHIALELSSLQEPSRSLIQNIEVENNNTWQQVEIRVPNLLFSIPRNPQEAVVEIAVTASAIPEATVNNSMSGFAIDAGSILIANPELHFSEQ